MEKSAIFLLLALFGDLVSGYVLNKDQSQETYLKGIDWIIFHVFYFFQTFVAYCDLNTVHHICGHIVLAWAHLCCIHNHSALDAPQSSCFAGQTLSLAEFKQLKLSLGWAAKQCGGN